MLIYLLLINTTGLIAVWYDKVLAKKGKYRIPESRLFLIALAGGAFGVFMGMQLFKHKTQHLRFTIGIPVIIIGQIILFRTFR
ncbi:MAG: hypothetical protein A4E52_00275 [Pelotomaculum sp. PtaB.Bin013]|uniref:DUF1294 domain-containing protein n=1 Tax=Pelotomaculum isophthalicicum JI TaxID=947010 RepID=A0A9X4GZG8_9FIRM|nr:DUF1294 domain-containing protein [Pelotomaculum isophthalicicum]MDF9408780.1 DUF1294 domain-containing protein [Pelotomaculum isophthalicicum JI]OPX91893.1 MAG: hypothetical protein A4E52_00275 [Pelotomaculum sp. PtaB.Bin013]